MNSKQLVLGVVLVGVCLSVVAVGVWRGGQTAQTGENTQPTENFEVTLSEINGFSTWTHTITVKDNGTVISENGFLNQNKVTKFGELTENELQEFKNFVIKANVFDFEDKYENFFVTDATWLRLNFVIGENIKQISVYPCDFGDWIASVHLPENLFEIYQKIYEFENKL